ncbi:MAG: fused DSP-PTPase phosphatase/NAD kinase-like protein [Shimia sp.]
MSLRRTLRHRWARLRLYIAFHGRDHGFLRVLWTNEAEVSPGIWRSNQPGPLRIRGWRRRGLRTILTLRGTVRPEPFRVLMGEAAAKGRIEIHDIPMGARAASPTASLLRAFRVLRTAPRPLLFHCKSGADRTGLVAAFWVLHEGGSDDAARAQLSMRHMHLRDHGKPGVLDHILEAYLARRREAPIGVEAWIAMEYHPARLQSAYNARRGLPPVW